MIEIRVPHALGLERARERLETFARERAVRLTADPGGLTGTVEKNAPFTGVVRARYEVLADAIELKVDELPAWLPEQTMRRLLEGELTSAFAG